jgi:hypothetical protein
MEFEEFEKFAKTNGSRNCLVALEGLSPLIEARIQREADTYFLCSDSRILDGASCRDKLGYRFSWAIGDQYGLDEGEIVAIKLAEPAEPFISEDDF